METFLTTDVLVIGGGLAGLRAAIQAKRAGLNVIIASKSLVGGASNSAISNAGFRSSINDFTKLDHKQLTLQTGAGLCDDRMVQILTDEAEESILELGQMGVSILPRKYGFYVPGPVFQEGTSITRPLYHYAKNIGVQCLHQFFAVDSLVLNNEVAGIWGLDLKSGNIAIIGAKSIVLATGGGGAIYDRTDNLFGSTGDGYALALRGGLELVDMEFVQFYPLSVTAKNGVSAFLPPVLPEVGKLINQLAEDLAEKYSIKDRPLAIRSRDRLSRAMALELEKDNIVLLDLTKSTLADWEMGGSIFGHDHDRVKQLRLRLEKRFGLEKEPIPVQPTTHFFMGGGYSPR